MRRIHLKRIYQGLLLIATGLCFIYLRISGEAYQLAKPLAGIYAMVFSVVCTGLGLVAIYYGLKPGLKLKTTWSEPVYLFSLSLMLILTYSPLTGAAFAGSDLLSANSGNFYFGTNPITSDDSALQAFNAENAKNGMATAVKDADGYMQITESRFVNMVDDLYINLNEFSGQKVRIEGFAIRMQGFKPNQLVVSRLLMTCCAADASGVGLMAEGDALKAFKDDDWLEVEGVIDAYTYDGDTIPRIKITKVKAVPAKKNKFVYYQQ